MMNHMNPEKFEFPKRENRDLINLNPLQTGGRLTEAAKKALVEFGDGYSVCDFCSGRLDLIKNPDISGFVHEALPEFLGADSVRLTHGAREGIFIVFHSVCKPGDTIIADANRHYSSVLAAERAGLKLIEVPNSGAPEFKINVDDYEPLIKKHKPRLLLLTYPDGNYGNLPDAKRLAEIAGENKVPLLLNAAYAAGRMPVDMNGIGADFMACSGHKSMSSSGPIGVLGVKKKWEDIVFRKSKYYKIKEVELLGCASRGAPVATLMASFREVVERVKNWDGEVENARRLSGELEKLGLRQLGEKPHNHDLMFFEAEALHEIAEKRGKGGFFLYRELKERGITGIKPGLTKAFKISSFGISREELRHVADSFREIMENGKS